MQKNYHCFKIVFPGTLVKGKAQIAINKTAVFNDIEK